MGTGTRNKTPRTNVSEVSTQNLQLLMTRTNTESTLMSMRRLTTDEDETSTSSREISRCNHSRCSPRFKSSGLYEASAPSLKRLCKKPSMIVVLAPIIRLPSGGIKVGPIDSNQKVNSLIDFLDTIDTPTK